MLCGVSREQIKLAASEYAACLCFCLLLLLIRCLFAVRRAATRSAADDFSALAAGAQLPYATLDVVFNQANLWGNRLNADPVVRVPRIAARLLICAQKVVFYFNDDTRWLPFVSETVRPLHTVSLSRSLLRVSLMTR